MIRFAKTLDSRARSVLHTSLKLPLALVVAWSFLSICGPNGQRLIAQAPSATSYQVLKLDPVFSKPGVLRRMQSAAKRYAYIEDAETFADANYAHRYYSEYLLAKITQPDALAEIGDLITSVRKRLDRAANSKSSGHLQMMRWIYDGMRPIAQGDYQPAARINAILLISRMDVSAADRTRRTGPVPASVIAKVLMPIYLDESAPDGVRVVALKGLKRYVKLAGHKLPLDYRTTLTREMNELLQGDAPPERDPVAHAYVQRYAVDILTHLPMSSQKGFAEHLVAISVDEKKHDVIAIHSAASIADLGDVSIGKLAASDVLAAWSKRAARVVDKEIARLKALTRPEPVPQQPASAESYLATKSSMSSERMQGEESMDAVDSQEEDARQAKQDHDARELFGLMPPVRSRRAKFDVTSVQPPEVVVSRRKLNQTLQQLHAGASGSFVMQTPERPTGLLKVADATAKPTIVKWLGSIQGVSAAINGSTLRDRQRYIDALERQSAAMKEAAKRLSSPKPAVPTSVPPLA